MEVDSFKGYWYVQCTDVMLNGISVNHQSNYVILDSGSSFITLPVQAYN